MDLIPEVLDNFLRVTFLEFCDNGRFAFCVLEDLEDLAIEVGSMAGLCISVLAYTRAGFCFAITVFGCFFFKKLKSVVLEQ